MGQGKKTDWGGGYQLHDIASQLVQIQSGNVNLCVTLRYLDDTLWNRIFPQNPQIYAECGYTVLHRVDTEFHNVIYNHSQYKLPLSERQCRLSFTDFKTLFFEFDLSSIYIQGEFYLITLFTFSKEFGRMGER